MDSEFDGELIASAMRRSKEARYLDQIKTEIKRIVQRCFELFNQYDIPMQAFRNLQITEDDDQWQMQSGIGPDWSTLELQFNIFSSNAATFEPLVNSILINPDLASKLPFGPNATDVQQRYNHLARGWLWRTFIKPCLDVGFTHGDKKQMKKLGKKKELPTVATKTRSILRTAILKIAESNHPFNPKDTETRLLGYRE
jgi:hypothetical protein